MRQHAHAAAATLAIAGFRHGGAVVALGDARVKLAQIFRNGSDDFFAFGGGGVKLFLFPRALRLNFFSFRGDSLFGIFNAIAAITLSDSYLGAVAIVVVCGFITVAIAYALAPERLVGWKWLGSVLLVYSILLVPKPVLALTLGWFAGVFLYLGASSLLPAAHEAGHSRWLPLATLAGAAVVYLAQMLAE